MIEKIKKRYALYSALMLSIAVFLQWLLHTPPNITVQKQLNSSIGNPATLNLAYMNWKSQNYRDKEAHLIRLPLTYIRNLSSHYTGATGMSTVDLVNGIIDVEVFDLSPGKNYAVWLVDQTSDTKKNKIYVGPLNYENESATLHVQLKAEDLAGFSMNQIMVAQEDSHNSGLLFGSPTLFQRLYYDEIRLQSKTVVSTQRVDSIGPASIPFSFLIPEPAFAAESNVDLAALVATGESLFFEETFGGNGRTCGTCHRAENNFTIDPEFIATLAADDPLFVAEFDPKLEKLENPKLMRDFGLILANLDGLEDPENKFVMRSVSHTLGLSMSIQSNSLEAPLQMTGWSGDGAPGGGTLRDFSTGAVVQHFTQSLDRVEGVDFRLPTAAELDALEAFMLSLGRQSDPDLNSLKLLNRDAERGRVLFLAEDSKNRTVQAAKCNICHRNAGALTVAGVNQNFITGVEDMIHPASASGELRPRDGGFGVDLNENTGAFGDGSFNTPSLWEAADTAPYFHHNGATTLEEAIAFYDSPEFKKSIEGQRLLLMDTGGQEMSVEIDALAAFLRVINVLENMRSSSDYMERAIGLSKTNAKKLLKLAKAEVNDILQVLAEGELHKETESYFKDAKELLDSARGTGKASMRDDLISQALEKVQTAKTFIVDTVPVTDNEPPSISIISPSAGDTVSGVSAIQVDAFDNVALTSVAIKVGTTDLGSLSSPPFSFSWDTSLFPDGLTTISAVATDGINQTSASILVTVENIIPRPVADTTNPTIQVLNPAEGDSVSGVVSIAVDANDDVAVDRVIFAIDQVELGVDSIAPYGLDWDTNLFSDGNHQLTITVIDTSHNSASAGISVTVDNIVEVCTVYSCPNPPPPSTEPPPNQTMPIGSSPDGEFDGVLESKDLVASTVTISTGDGPIMIKITAETEFLGSVAANIDDLLVGHIVQGEFFSSTNEIVWIEADLPPGL